MNLGSFETPWKLSLEISTEYCVSYPVSSLISLVEEEFSGAREAFVAGDLTTPPPPSLYVTTESKLWLLQIL